VPPVEVRPVRNTTPRIAFDIAGIIGTGQSLSVGAQATQFNAISQQPRFNNLKLAGVAGNPPFNPNAGG
jgi:hypothetical protein